MLVHQVDLTGGYYDAGDNVKYGLPLAFTVTTLAWAALAFQPELQATGELKNVHAAIKWGTDYFLKCTTKKNHMWVQVGDPNLDHQCWVRPENMNTPRTLYQIDDKTPGTEIAAETAAALAASAIVFRNEKDYSRRLLNKAKLVTTMFASSHAMRLATCLIHRNISCNEFAAVPVRQDPPEDVRRRVPVLLLLLRLQRRAAVGGDVAVHGDEAAGVRGLHQPRGHLLQRGRV